MFRHHDDAARQKLLEFGTRAVADVQEAHASKPKDGEVQWQLHLAWLVPHQGIVHASIEQLLPDGFVAASGKLPILFNPEQPTECTVDLAHLHDPEIVAPPVITVAHEPAAGPRWVVPAECPNCGAVVDQATASMAADPKCPFCEQPLPVQPAPNAAS